MRGKQEGWLQLFLSILSGVSGTVGSWLGRAGQTPSIPRLSTHTPSTRVLDY